MRRREKIYEADRAWHPQRRNRQLRNCMPIKDVHLRSRKSCPVLKLVRSTVDGRRSTVAWHSLIELQDRIAAH